MRRALRVRMILAGCLFGSASASTSASTVTSSQGLHHHPASRAPRPTAHRGHTSLHVARRWTRCVLPVHFHPSTILCGRRDAITRAGPSGSGAMAPSAWNARPSCASPDGSPPPAPRRRTRSAVRVRRSTTAYGNKGTGVDLCATRASTAATNSASHAPLTSRAPLASFSSRVPTSPTQCVQSVLCPRRQ